MVEAGQTEGEGGRGQQQDGDGRRTANWQQKSSASCCVRVAMVGLATGEATRHRDDWSGTRWGSLTGRRCCEYHGAREVEESALIIEFC